MAIDLMTSNSYDAEKIADKAQQYNLIIYTTQGTFDTTTYNLSASATEKISNAVQDNVIGKTLVLAYNPKGAVKITHSDATDLGKSKHKIIEIVDKSITKVIVKSKRDFLGNQGTFKKLS